VTSHRLFFYSSISPALYSFSLDLAHIGQTDHYAGLFTSSPKVTLYLDPLDDTPEPEQDGVGGWECQVCSYRNPPGTSRNAQVCGLCGVPRSSAHEPVSASLPTSRSVTPLSSTIACSACTFLNQSSLTNCEICGTALPTKRAATAPPSPALTAVDDPDPRLVKLSFRKGGDKPLYIVLKRSLQSKAWEVCAGLSVHLTSEL
jgi:ESCRT-II complex subunit VPS36